MLRFFNLDHDNFFKATFLLTQHFFTREVFYFHQKHKNLMIYIYFTGRLREFDFTKGF